VVENGMVTVPSGPGLGLALAPDVLARGQRRTTTEADL
jgi:L-alanine-DL-glutamate epimerase-like enolase superfamily enzyme